jgi:hypothetical protein
MLLNQSLSRLQFDDDTLIHPQVSIVLTDYLTLIQDIYWLSLFDSESLLLKFDSKGILINLLKKARSKSVVDLIRAANDRLGEVIVLHKTSNKTLRQDLQN